MSILIGCNARDSKLAAKIFNMALAYTSFGGDIYEVNENQAFDNLCKKELLKAFEPYSQKHKKNGFGDIALVQICTRGDALVCAYRCNHKAVSHY